MFATIKLFLKKEERRSAFGRLVKVFLVLLLVWLEGGLENPITPLAGPHHSTPLV